MIVDDLKRHTITKSTQFKRKSQLQNSEVIGHWSKPAPYWDKHNTVIREMFAPVSQALVEDAKVARGSTVLDIAAGPAVPEHGLPGDGRLRGTHFYVSGGHNTSAIENRRDSGNPTRNGAIIRLFELRKQP